MQMQIVEHFGLSTPQDECVPIAARVREWFERKWQGLRPPVNIFVAVLEEGADVWRPVQARPLSEAGVFRIIGVAADVADEVWQFPAGAIVRCESKRFSGGETGMVAIEELKESG
jgi:hypothetical protein